MTRSLHILIIALLTAGLWGCAEQRAPTDAAHPAGWVLAHGAQADENLGSCTTCHGAELAGGTSGVACLDCHLDGPPFRTHPQSWTDVGADHREFPERYSWTGCAAAACHGTGLKGGDRSGSTGPSCFTAENCHAEGPPAPHGAAYSNPELHGPAGRGGQRYCGNCHGRPQQTFDGGYVSDPVVGIGGRACATCHPAAKAHSTNWQGTNDPTPDDHLSTHWPVPEDAVAESCSLCHNVVAAGPGPVAGAPSCFTAEFTNADGNPVGCHVDGPGNVHGGNFSRPSRHGPEAREDLRYCQLCHGSPGTTAFDGGLADTACNECHPAAGGHPTDWQGAGTYSHRVAKARDSACVICHDVSVDRPPPNPAAPSCFSSSFENAAGQLRACHPGGPGPVHEDGFADPSDHGATAKQDLTRCQQCHGTPGGTEFGGGIAGVACDQCHPEARAHPADWRGLGSFAHTTASNRQVACGLCHDAVDGRVAPDPTAPSCFQAEFDVGEGQARPCHAGGPGVPPHPGEGFAVPALHGTAAKADVTYCQQCHGVPGTSEFDGSVLADTACQSCHAAARAHPTDWQGSGPYAHVTAGSFDSACGICHQVSTGGETRLAGAPSCFSPEFTNGAGQTRPCHVGGPGVPPHGETGYADPAQHGAEAKTDLLYCQQCHGAPGTPAFGGSVLTRTDCHSCHLDARAHPTDWQGLGLYSHRDAGQSQPSCAVCHNVIADGPGPDPVAPSCFSALWQNSEGQTRACHPDGPGPVHGDDFSSPLNHGVQAKDDLGACQQCHGSPGGTEFGGGIAGLSCVECHPQAEAHPGNWQGDPNSGTYSHRSAGALSAACGLCHPVVQGNPGPDPTAPSCFTTVFDNTGTPSGVRACHPGGPGPVHASATFSDPAEHGRDAKADLTECQPCHAAPYNAVALDSDPTFDVPNGLLVAGCESAGCHATGAAHPLPWLGPEDTSHQSAGNMVGACTLCHALDGVGADSPRSCHDCHAAGSPLQAASCISCHNTPPDGEDPAGADSPNQDGSHTTHGVLPELAGACDACHSGVGANTLAHFDDTEPADVILDAVYDARSASPGGAVYSPAGGTCVDVSCHGGQATPEWFTEVLDVDSECQRCHGSDSDSSDQFNDYRNAEDEQHDFHLSQDNPVPLPARPITCTDCHDPGALANGHFDTLATPEMEGPAAAGVGGGSTFVVSYDAADNRCVINCHAPENW